MEKKIVALVTACMMCVVFTFFTLYVFNISSLQKITVEDIVSNPSAWLSKTILIEGNLNSAQNANITIDDIAIQSNLTKLAINSSPLFSPWQYNLTSDGASIGVSWSKETAFNNIHVHIRGVVEELSVINSFDPLNSTNTYFISAENIEFT